jgi:DNA-binding NarL/FixJ family response regulator
MPTKSPASAIHFTSVASITLIAPHGAFLTMTNGTTSASGAPVRILVVDDVEPWRRSVCKILRAHERLHVVDQAADGLEAVQKSQELKPDLILLDIGLPRLNGIEAASRIGKVAPGSKVLFLTQNLDADVARMALSNGAKGYVLKIDAASELLPAIETALNGERFVSKRLRPY